MSEILKLPPLKRILLWICSRLNIQEMCFIIYFSVEDVFKHLSLESCDAIKTVFKTSHQTTKLDSSFHFRLILFKKYDFYFLPQIMFLSLNCEG